MFRKEGKFKEAREVYTKALEKNADYLPVIRNLGILCDIYIQDLQCALDQYERYLEMEPEDKEVKIWAADLKRRVGQ